MMLRTRPRQELENAVASADLFSPICSCFATVRLATFVNQSKYLCILDWFAAAKAMITKVRYGMIYDRAKDG